MAAQCPRGLWLALLFTSLLGVVPPPLAAQAVRYERPRFPCEAANRCVVSLTRSVLARGDPWGPCGARPA